MNRSTREVVPLLSTEYEELVTTLTFLTRRDTSLRLYQRLLTALREMGTRCSVVSVNFEPHNYKPPKRRKARR